MDSKDKLHSEEDLNTDMKYQTSSNYMSNTNQNDLNNKYQPITIYRNNKIPKINIKKGANSIKSRIPKKSIKSQTSFIQKIVDSKSVPKTSPFSFKYFCNIANKKKSLHNSSLGINSIKQSNDMESNFINLSKNANIYTSSADYIQNKKMLLFDKTTYDDSKYRPDRANVFDMTNIPIKPNKNSTLYKTTMFRGGKLYFGKKQEKNKKFDNKEDLKKKVKNRFYENMPIDNMIKFIEQNKEYLFENLFPRIPKKNIESHESKEKEKKKLEPYDSLYKKLMSKKDEIFDNLLKNNIDENNKVIISHDPHQKSNYNFNNSSTINLQNNSIETNILNNSISNKYNSSTKFATNFSGYSNLLSKKKNDGIPIIFPVVSSTFAKCNSVSQSSRYQNIMDNFIKVKTLIENDKELGKNNEFEYIKEFLINKKIDQKHINMDNLINFSKFLNCDKIPIDLNKSLKENILIGLYYEENTSKINSRISNQKTDYSPNKNYKYFKNKLLLGHRKSVEYNINKNKNNYKSLILDLPRQKRLYINDENKSDIKLREELHQEISMIENEIQNKQNIIKKIEKDLNLTPLYYNYYNNLRMNRIKDERESKSIELRLASTQEINRSKFINNSKIDKKLKTNGNIYDSNERLYYSWYRNKKQGDLNNFKKRSKLTEFIMYNKTKEKILNEKLGVI
jgi:hypothetical protein